MKFVITLFQDEDGVFIAECPSIPGCVSQGKTESEAESNICQTIKECLDVREAKGRPLMVSTRSGRGCQLMPPGPVLRRREIVKTFEKLGNLTDDY